MEMWGVCGARKMEEGLIHPCDDVRSAWLRGPGNRVVQRLERRDETLILLYGETTFRARQDSFVEVDAPKFRIGDVVRVMVPGQPPRRCVVREILWHFKWATEYYLLKTPDGTPLRSRYWPEELAREEAAPRRGPGKAPPGRLQP